MTEVEQVLLAALQELKDKGPTHEEYGICSNANTLMRSNQVPTDIRHHADYKLSLLAQQWEHYSGYPFYPVPHTERAADDAYTHYRVAPKWDKNTEYGHLRWELLDFLIATLSKSSAIL